MYIVFNILLPLFVFVLVRMDFVQLALAMILLSKWRMFAVRPRFWPAHIRANAVDIIVSVSLLLFMVNSDSQLMQLVWTAIYMGWLVVLKPASDAMMISIQALVGFLCGLMAIFVGWSDGPLYGLVALTGTTCYLTARHFFDSFDEPYAKLLSYMWGYFGAALVWVLGHWLLYYGIIAQPVLLLLAIGYGLATLYYLDHYDRLSGGVRRQSIFVMVAIIMIVLIFSDWGDKIV
ncbi:MAG: hypothetical protein AAB834_05180 [Patescibacteria group bacterium]